MTQTNDNVLMHGLHANPFSCQELMDKDNGVGIKIHKWIYAHKEMILKSKELQEMLLSCPVQEIQVFTFMTIPQTNEDLKKTIATSPNKYIRKAATLELHTREIFGYEDVK